MKKNDPSTEYESSDTWYDSHHDISADSASMVMTNDTQQRYHQSNKSLPSQSTSKSNET